MLADHDPNFDDADYVLTLWGDAETLWLCAAGMPARTHAEVCIIPVWGQTLALELVPAYLDNGEALSALVAAGAMRHNGDSVWELAYSRAGFERLTAALARHGAAVLRGVWALGGPVALRALVRDVRGTP